MATPILATKLYIPALRSQVVARPRLIERLNDGLTRKLTLVSASAGSGKTTLVSEWVASCGLPATWLSLDEADNDPTRFLAYLIAALQKIEPGTGDSVLMALQSPQPAKPEALLTSLLNDIASIHEHFILVLDDYHVIEAKPVDDALTFLLDHLPPPMHLVIATREDPQLPLARLRARAQLVELRISDLRFTFVEAAGFLNQVMNLDLAAEDIAALESRTEGWIAGLQLAALSMQGHEDTSAFIKSFTGSHRFVLDYLAEEVFQKQPEHIQTFLLYTSLLDRMCGALCDAVLLDPSISGQATLEYLEQSNLFIIPLDNERRWYRYHHLFGDLLRQRLYQSIASSTADGETFLAELHMRASRWYEANDLDIEAFQHAVAAQNIEQATRLIEGNGMPLLFRGAFLPILNWLKSLPAAVLDAHPSLWVMYGSALLFASQISGIEGKLQAAEAALAHAPQDAKTRDLLGHIASIRATVAVTQHQAETIITQSLRALEYVHPENLPVRAAATWSLGYAYQLQGKRRAAREAYDRALAISQAIGHYVIILMSSIGQAFIQEGDNHLETAAKTYHHILQLMGESPPPFACQVYLGLARIYYAWNDLDTAQQHGQQSVSLAHQLETTDRAIACEVFLARLRLARGDLAGAAAILVRANRAAQQQHFVYRLPEIAEAQVLISLRQGNFEAAAHLARTHDLPLSQARVDLAQGNPAAALTILAQLRQKFEAKGWEDERLRVMVLQVVALLANGEKAKAVRLLQDALALAEPGGLIRIFVDEGAPIASLLSEIADREPTAYLDKLLAAFEAEKPTAENWSAAGDLIEPLSPRELEVLQLIASGLSNHEIGERLFLALDTVKGHNRRIYGKLQVQRRTEAVARARELGLL